MNGRGEDTLALLATDVDSYYEQMVLLYWHQLKAFIVQRTANAQDAEDIVQEALIRAYEALWRYPTEQIRTLKVRAWLYKITWNIYCNYMTRSKPAGTIPFATLEDDALFDIEDEREAKPEEAFEQLERKQEVRTLVESLPEHYRIVVSMYYFEELSYQEIADILNQPLGTVKVYIHRGIKLLRKELATRANEIR